ncbi:MAG: hypothetical protein SFW36_19390 [Leptolyngbyaceae cyanobacterium bins.59]|nr:hypothetical protein [Leptolyngbyaceae cyanobacterium bins.59]
MLQLELDLWGVLKQAAQEPETADLKELFCSLDSALVSLDTCHQLQVVAEAIAQIVQIFEDRSLNAFEELESQILDEGPIVALNFFDRFVRQSMQIDLAQFVEPPLFLLPRLEYERQILLEENGESLVGTVEKEAMLAVLAQVEQDEEVAKQEALAVAHEEDISLWVEAIVAYLQGQIRDPIPLLDLVREVQYPEPEGYSDPGTLLVKTWLTLLLGGFSLEQRGEFYSSDIWVSRC